MSLSSDLQQHLDAGFSGFWVQTDEVYDAQEEIVKLSNKNRLLCLSWTLDEGLQLRDDWTRQWAKQARGTPPTVDKPDDMLARLPDLSAQLLREQEQNPAVGNADVKPIEHDAQHMLLLLPNFHLKPFAESAKLTHQLSRLPLLGKMRTGRFAIVVLSHTVKIPPEYEKLFVTLRHSLPGDTELTRIATKLDPTVKEDVIRPAVHAARGLTRVEAENAFSLTVVRSKPFDPQLVWDLKAQMIEKSGLMTIYRGDASADRMGGLGHFFAYAESLLTGYDGSNPLLRPRGLLLLGVPGSGKSEAVKCLSNRLKRPLIEADIGKLMGGLVGETEANVRRMLAIADAMAPCTLFLDEIEKALGGSGGDGRNDGGVGKRLLGSLLTWLNDHTTDVFFVGTCNDASNLSSALTRAERFDAKFFFDLPNAQSRSAIWDIYLKLFELPVMAHTSGDYMHLLRKSGGWTGAEIRSCCRLAAMRKRPVLEVSETIVPVSKMYGSEINSLRKWAQGNCLAADHDAIYVMPAEETCQTIDAVVYGEAPAKPDTRVINKKKKKLSFPARST